MNSVIIDLHCHTQEKSYDGKVPALAMITKLMHLGFSGVVFTDHNNVWSTDELNNLRSQANAPQGFLLLSGQEVRTAVGELMCGDVLVYGPTESIPDGTQITDVLKRAKETNGFCIAAHPGVSMIGMGKRIGDFPLLAAETWNGRYGAKIAAESEQLCNEIGLPATGGSDAHQESEIGGGGTIFPALPNDFAQLSHYIQTQQVQPYRPTFTTKLKRWMSTRS
ncbi:MAG: PHP domain-containing protein [Sumerlaeia bacterium]